MPRSPSWPPTESWHSATEERGIMDRKLDYPEMADPMVRPRYTGIPTFMRAPYVERSEEHTSELQSPDHIVCRLLLEKKKRASVCACRRYVENYRSPGLIDLAHHAAI